MSRRSLIRSAFLRAASFPVDLLDMALVLSLGMAIVAGIAFFAGLLP